MSQPTNGAPLNPNTTATMSLAELIENASALLAADTPEKAQALYRDWIAKNDSHPLVHVALFNRSAIDTQVGDTEAAVDALKQIITHNPDFIPAYINLGRALDRSGATSQAMELWQTAVLRPLPITGMAIGLVEAALKHMARVLTERSEHAFAEQIMERSLTIDPHQRDVAEQYVATRLAQCKWPAIVALEGVSPKALVRSIHPLSMAAFTDDPMLQLAVAESYSRLSIEEDGLPFEFDRRHAPIELDKRRLRVGYISSDLRDHAIGYLMAEFFELHGKNNDIEVFAYYCGQPSTSALTCRIKAAAEHWTDIRNMNDDDAAKTIAKDGIDILVDVNGHTRDSRTGVFMRRPAPVQVNWLGFPGTMGTPYHHYIIADEWIIPPKSEIYYSEKVLRLPCYQANDRKRVVASERPSRRDAGLPDDAMVFCCFNGAHKITRFTFARWMRILTGVPGSALWLLDASPEVNKRLGDQAEALGVARERLVFAPKVHNTLHLARYALADLFLDTLPYGAHTTASDSLWSAVPVLTVSGRNFASRVCGSLVRSAGLPELVCSAVEEYVARAIELGNNRSQLEQYRRRLEEGRDHCVLFDMDKLVASIEQLYRTIANEHNAGRTPQPDLANLAEYLKIGSEFDHEATEMSAVADYEGFYKSQLARRYQVRPFPHDARLWSADDIAAIASQPTQDGHVNRTSAAAGTFQPVNADGLRALSQKLFAAGRHDEALHVLEQLADSAPSDGRTFQILATLLCADGRVLESLKWLHCWKSAASDFEPLVIPVQEVLPHALDKFNAALAAKEIVEAEKYIDALIALIPLNQALLDTGISLAISLGRTAKAKEYARTLLQLVPTHSAARELLAA